MDGHSHIILDFNEGSVLLNKLREIMNKHDPIGIYAGADINFDEYDSEILEIARRFNYSFTLDDFTIEIHKIFQKWFDQAIAGPVDLYLDLSREIYEFLENEVKQREIS